jgi:GT2 family glycosyltransferase
MPRLTVVMPTYERTTYLTRALTSVLGQTYTDIAIKINDNSETDAIERFLEAYPDPRIVYEKRRANLGGGLNWICSLQEPDTEYVASLNDDDAWEPTFLEKLVAELDANPTAAMAFSEYRTCDEFGELWEFLDTGNREAAHWALLAPGLHRAGSDDLLRAIVVWFAVRPAWAGVSRTEAVRAVYFPSEVTYVGDLWLPYMLYQNGHDFVFVKEVLADYRFHHQNVSTSGKSVDDYVFRHVLDHLPERQAPLKAEILGTWSTTRWRRQLAMTRLPRASRQRRREIAEIAPHISGKQRIVARFASWPLVGLPVMKLFVARNDRIVRNDGGRKRRRGLT